MTVLCDSCSPKRWCSADKNRTECRFYQPHTNEEWFDSLTTNEKAYHLADICAWAMEEFRCGNTEKSNIDYWEKWLKEKHDGM